MIYSVTLVNGIVFIYLWFHWPLFKTRHRTVPDHKIGLVDDVLVVHGRGVSTPSGSYGYLWFILMFFLQFFVLTKPDRRSLVCTYSFTRIEEGMCVRTRSIAGLITLVRNFDFVVRAACYVIPGSSILPSLSLSLPLSLSLSLLTGTTLVFTD